MAATKRALDLAGVPDYSEVVSSMSEETTSVSSLTKESKRACEFCGATAFGLQQCKQCQKGIYCSTLCMAEHHLGFCARR
jgi:hypothetical protein